MRLINTSTFKLEEFNGGAVPRYAILSHTWGKDTEEVSYHDLQYPTIARCKTGWGKIQRTCDRARAADLKYAWVDTCCIDKSSSAELLEAINSMFAWYSESDICYAYLSDLGSDDADLGRCRWFTRGWTLQELIGPPQLEFYDRDWNFKGTKKNLCKLISAFTGIDEKVLQHDTYRGISSVLSDISVAKRMSWAAKRQTKRVEDIAYCLLGIFGVNMPLLYGERERAFIRLQGVIANELNDLSLFAWTAPNEESQTSGSEESRKYRGVMAAHPSEFAQAGSLVLRHHRRFNPEFTITNKGLRTSTRLLQDTSRNHVLDLSCFSLEQPTGGIGIYLKHYGGSTYVRAKPHGLASTKDLCPVPECTIYITKDPEPEGSESVESLRQRGAHLTLRGELKTTSYEHIIAEPRHLWDTTECRFITPDLSDFTAYHLFSSSWHGTSSRFLVACGLRAASPWACIVTPSNHPELFGAGAGGDLKQVGELGCKTDAKCIRLDGGLDDDDGGGFITHYKLDIEISLVTETFEGELTVNIELTSTDDSSCSYAPKGSRMRKFVKEQARRH